MPETVDTTAETAVFAEFCAAGLWPELSRAIAAKLPAAGIVP